MQTIKDIRELQGLDNLDFIARQIVEGFITGMHRSPFHGFSVEFAEHRLYNTGESTKHIDWKLFARTEKLFVKRFEEETNLRSQIVLDVSPSMFFPVKDKEIPAKISFAVYTAAAVVYLLRKQRDAAGLTLFSDEIELHTQARLSGMHASMMYHELDKILEQVKSGKPPQQKTTYAAKALHQIADSIHKRSLVILFSDMFTDEAERADETFSALQHLRHKGHEVILFHVLDKTHEYQFGYHNRPYRFVDMETGQEMRINPNDIRDDYQKHISRYFHELKMRCGQYRIDFVEVDVRENFMQVLMPYLIKRKKLM